MARRRLKSAVPGWLRLWFLGGILLLIGAVGAAADETRILDIEITGSAGAPVVFIKTSERPNSSVYSRSDPLQIVVDIANAAPDNAGLSPRGVAPISKVGVEEFRTRDGVVSRVAIYLDQVSDFTSETTEDGLIVRLSAQATADPGGSSDLDPLGEQLARMESGEAVALPTPAPAAAGSRTAPTTASKPPAATAPAASTAPAAPARTSTPARASATASYGAQITGLDFLPYPDRSRVRIQTDRKATFTSEEAAGDQVVLTLQGVGVPKPYQRPLDTRDFPSAVEMVSAYTAARSNGARVVIKLREGVPWEVSQEDTFIYVDFEVPAHLAQAAAQFQAQGGTTDGAPAASIPVPTGQGAAPAGQTATLISGMGQMTEYGPAGSRATGSDMGLFGSGAIYSDPGGDAQFSGTRFSIDLRGADIHNVFRLISAVSNVNIVTSDDVSGKVTLRLVDVPWDQALMVILQSKGLGAVRYGNIIRIAPTSTLAKEREDAKKAQDLSKDLEPTSILVLPLNYASVSEVSEQVQSVLSERGKLTVDTRTNSLIIEDTAQHLARAQAMLTKLDTQTPAVLIEARVVEANTSFLREFGIQWGGNLDVSANTGSPTGLYFPNVIQAGGGQSQSTQATPVFPSLIDAPNWVIDLPTNSSGVALNLALGSISDIVSLDARLTAIETTGNGKVISSPRITTIDNKQAQIVDGARIPYETVSAGGTQVQFINASLELSVTPHITADNRVFMQISVSNNRPDFGNQVGGRPTIVQKEAKTEVMIADGDTTVIGGVYSYTISESRSGLPGLYKIPVLGALFRSTLYREDRKELLVFITPHILEPGTSAPSQASSF